MLVKKSLYECKQQPRSTYINNIRKTSYLKNVFIYRRCRWHRWLIFTFGYLRNFHKNLKWLPRYTQVPWGNWFMKKTWCRKSCVRLPLKQQLHSHCILSRINSYAVSPHPRLLLTRHAVQYESRMFSCTS
jgi:hypothetical protein